MSLTALSTTDLYYDANFSGDKALSDEFGNKVRAFIEVDERN